MPQAPNRQPQSTSPRQRITSPKAKRAKMSWKRNNSQYGHATYVQVFRPKKRALI